MILFLTLILLRSKLLCKKFFASSNSDSKWLKECELGDVRAIVSLGTGLI